MISDETLAGVLFAVATGATEVAADTLATAPGLTEEYLDALTGALRSSTAPVEQARALGDELRALSAPRSQPNECYRAAYYLSGRWVEDLDNPIAAYMHANRSGVILDKWMHYAPVYHRHLARFRGTDARVLEIGSYQGGGLRLLRSYLGPQATIVGMDIDPHAAQQVHADFDIVLGDAEDPEFLAGISRQFGPFDVVIDDGGHTVSQQITSAETLFPLLTERGVLIVEDTHTSYWPEYGGALRGEDTFLEWAKAKVDDLHAIHDRQLPLDTVWTEHLDGLHVYDSMVVLEKAPQYRHFAEMSGSPAYLLTDRSTEGKLVQALTQQRAAQAEAEALRGELAAVRAQLDGGPQPEPVTTAAEEELRRTQAEFRATQERLRLLGGELQAVQSELDTTRGKLIGAWDQMRLMRSSLSWRVTAPLRAVRYLWPR